MARPPDEDNFLSRWSRRKRTPEADAPDPAPDAEPSPDARPDARPDPGAEMPPGPTPITQEELAALPAIEDLVPGSDIRAFLRPGVPKALRNAALRRIWLLTDSIRNHADPAVDYAWDWNTPGGVPGDGAAPAPERMAEMLRALRDPPAREPTIEPDPDAEADHPQRVPEEATAPVARARPEPPRPDPVRPEPSRTAASDPADPEPEAPRLRHGGARPV